MATTTTSTSAPTPVQPSTRAAFVALLGRDLAVLRKEFGMFLGRTVVQPFLLVFVFTYVFPKIGQGVGGGPGGETAFSTILVGGVIASTMIFQGIQAVALPLVQDFGYTREIEDRVLAPLPVGGVALEKVAAGAVQALLAGALVFPMAAIIPATPVVLDVEPVLLAVVMLLGSVMSAALGLFVGTRVQPNQVPLIFGLLVLPMTFLGCVYYPWQALEAIRWLQVLVLINPLVYLSEGMRTALTDEVPHMNIWLILVVMIAVTAVLLRSGIRGFRRRVLS